ncbi:sirohydrochlorin chelatase [Gracilibacillus caseinilyticus]|uniref:Sirohydrochlorin chelatase n=1 Tax=Gracilibacillus caseinilyticus TaxID=2932256 RepID=A0ABY4EVQ5_9BACI|nr:sirohydrochlorin chelatase [Gracilibacillus caseinilyticus]UOQ48065.1 sirohydrochlorin chelatase [Gracilibacillus caseinilyticus]
MEAVIYICHGSRLTESKKESIELIEKVKNNIDAPIQETCFLELQEPTLAQAIDNAVKQGATNLYIMPILLLTAGHAKKDIPAMIEKEKEKHSNLSFYYGRAIEVEPKMIEVLVDRINACTNDPGNYDMLLVGRGSSDPQAVENTETLAEMLRHQFSGNRIEKCFLAASEPKFEPFLADKVHQGKSVLVIPYILFTGLLDRGIKDYLTTFELEPGQEILRSDYLGHHPLIVDILTERVVEVREGASTDATMAERSS